MASPQPTAGIKARWSCVATAVDHAFADAERAARQLRNTREVAKTHYIDIPETVPDNRAVLEAWTRGTNPET